MHILFLTQVLPYPLDAGPKTRAYYILRYLAQFHQITLVSFVRQTDTPEAIAHLRQFCAHLFTTPMPRSMVLDGVHLLKSLATNQPFIITRDQVGAMFTLLDEIVERPDIEPFDAIHADQLWMATYAHHARQQQVRQGAAANGHAPINAPITVLDQHNAVYLIPQRMAGDTRNPIKRAVLQLESHKMARYEIACCDKFDHVLWVTQEDYQAVQSQAPTRTIPSSGIIPICVDVDEQAPLTYRPTGPTSTSTGTSTGTTPRRITFLGGLHYPPNAEGVLWFAEKILPNVLASVPDAIFTVIGKQPPDLSKFAIPQANLEVTGYVVDPKPYLQETAAFIVPLHAGGGMRVKILDAWQWGLPIVSTTVGAEGLTIRPGENILIEDDPDAFAAATIQLLTNPQQGYALAQAGRDWVKEHYYWRKTYQRLDAIYPHNNAPADITPNIPSSTPAMADQAAA